MSAGEAFVTLATTDSYCMGATVVARSLRQHGTTRKIVVMVTPNVSQHSRLALESEFDGVVVVDPMDSEDRLHLSLLGRPELGTTFTKIHCWTLTQYSKCVFLDADTLILCNVDELFERDELSAAPDPGWPDCFNSGVFVLRPSLDTHARLLDHALQHGSFDGGDQGLLNSFFSSWPVEDISKHLPFVYNLSASSIYSYLPAFQQFGHNAKIVHFLGAVKPWSSSRQSSCSPTMEQFVTLWWKEYLGHITASAPEKQPTRGWEKPQQIEEQEAKMPFRENLDSSNSLLPHFSSQNESHHSPPAPEPKPEPEIEPEMITRSLRKRQDYLRGRRRSRTHHRVMRAAMVLQTLVHIPGLQTVRWRRRSIEGSGRPDRWTTWAGTPSKTSRGSWTASWIRTPHNTIVSRLVYHSYLFHEDWKRTNSTKLHWHYLI
ncbi:glycogenin-2 isoform X1 [Toxotes jaculatrix]|uniref:glycogenin-2 isoform X1 n=1 Tax=Toxotes jaculatrix TaxID=941984 RepID=UPI001B3AF5A9|nr:glycogenin-2 isoform X1 [Toxotes jaculatrix]